MTILIFILTLALLVLVHEFGHFIAAKKQGVRVDEFGIGLPPRIFGIKKGETLYSINLLPFGGFVKLFGEEHHEIKKKTLSKKAFINKTPWQKSLIIVAGVIGNFLLGWVLLTYLFTQGVPVPTNNVIVEKVSKNSPADKAGIKNNDIILNFKTSEELIAFSKKKAGSQINLDIQRGENKINIVLTPRKITPKGEGPLGIVITSFIEKKFPWYSAPFYGIIEASKISYKIGTELLKVLGRLVTFQKLNVDVAGPVGIANYAQTALNFGRNAYLELIALLSFNLAIINILPFPALDGGRLMFVLYEGITRKKINKNIEKYVNLGGMLILLSLALLITINDIVKIMK